MALKRMCFNVRKLQKKDFFFLYFKITQWEERVHIKTPIIHRGFIKYCLCIKLSQSFSIRLGMLHANSWPKTGKIFLTSSITCASVLSILPSLYQQREHLGNSPIQLLVMVNKHTAGHPKQATEQAEKSSSPPSKSNWAALREHSRPQVHECQEGTESGYFSWKERTLLRRPLYI